MSQDQKPNKDKCELCPCRINSNNPSPMALERIHAIQAEKSLNKKRNKTQLAVNSEDLGCPWSINSAEHKYCFHIYKINMDTPVPDREICKLLGITQTQLKETYESAVAKLIKIKDEPEMQEWRDLLYEKIACQPDNSALDVGESIIKKATENSKGEDEESKEENIREAIEKIKKTRKINMSGQPVHRDGKKIDLYNLTSSKKIHDKKPKKPKKSVS